jgi:hypothetical protein
VAEISLFSSCSRPAAQRRRAVLFAGNLSVHKLDVPLLEAIARKMQGQGELLLAGPIGGGFELQRLQALGARYLGALSHAELAEVAGTCAVGLIPYAINDYTRGVSPLKCFEYVAAGMSVLSTRLPAVDELAKMNPHVVTADAASLPAQLLAMLPSTTDALIADRIASAAEHGWAQRGEVLREILSAELIGRLHA